MKKYKITLLMKNRETIVRKVKCSQDNINEIFTMVDNVMKNQGGGVLTLGNTYISMSQIVSYQIERSWF